MLIFVRSKLNMQAIFAQDEAPAEADNDDNVFGLQQTLEIEGGEEYFLDDRLFKHSFHSDAEFGLR